MTKIEMAQVITQYLEGYDSLPPKNHSSVKRIARFKKEYLKESYKVSKEMLDIFG